MKKFAHLAILILATTGAMAQDWSFDARAGLAFAQGDMRALTRKAQGMTFELGGRNTLEVAGLDYRLHLGHVVVRRKAYNVPSTNYLSDTADVKGTWLGADIFYPVHKGFEVYTGPQLTSWDVTAKTAGPLGDTNLHLGWRVGASWAFTKRWSLNATYTLSEWQKYNQRVSDPAKGNTVGAATGTRTTMNPSWFSLTASYRF